ncbi:hypothetical protein [Dactylosporangium sp. NPDC051541]|uniref:hypothetical protein n=1 Tax=Dactylosporangium sp. NPDC051541 TaxID=3363977 RepID=UPI00378A60A0
MIEILDDLGVLASRDLDPTALTLAGVFLGARAADALPRRRITQVSGSPLVHHSYTGTGLEPKYYDAANRLLPVDEVIDSVIATHGMVHYADDTGYKIVSGSVAGFALYDAGRGHLAHFDFLRTYEQFLDTFGYPDRADESRIYGDLMGYSNYYWRSRRQASWDASAEDGSGHLSLVNVGDYPGNAGG